MQEATLCIPLCSFRLIYIPVCLCFLPPNFVIQLSSQAPSKYIFHPQCILLPRSVLHSQHVCIVATCHLSNPQSEKQAVLHSASFKLAFFLGSCEQTLSLRCHYSYWWLTDEVFSCLSADWGESMWHTVQPKRLHGVRQQTHMGVVLGYDCKAVKQPYIKCRTYCGNNP